MERKLAEWRARQVVERPLDGGQRLGDHGVFWRLWRRLRPRRRGPELQQVPLENSELWLWIPLAWFIRCVDLLFSLLIFVSTPQEKKENDQNSLQDKAVERPIETDHFVFTIVHFLKLLLWLVLLGLFIELEFGLVYFVLSMFYWIYVGTRDPSERKQGEMLKSEIKTENAGRPVHDSSKRGERNRPYDSEYPLQLMGIPVLGSLIMGEQARKCKFKDRDHTNLLSHLNQDLWIPQILQTPQSTQNPRKSTSTSAQRECPRRNTAKHIRNI
ncbi:SAYSvFN domain-containing protein 1 [Narcine bancroftii]|uniref:SAYSvFN domain-containing protein 1 n=1 Tax=Narcine bancroftii TaxID=1343680 RepID=UPI0038317C04